MPDKHLQALELISENEKVELVTSKKTFDEFEKTPILRTKRHLKVLFKIIQKVYAPPAISHYSGLWGDTPWGVAPFGGGPGIWEHKTYSGLKAVFDKDDAVHIHNAKEGGCDVFLTLDFRTIINRYRKNKSQVCNIISPMIIADPISLQESISHPL
jgi:predicted nucleic acid-binding protein